MASKKKSKKKSNVEETNPSDEIDKVVHAREVEFSMMARVDKRPDPFANLREEQSARPKPVPSIDMKRKISQIRRRHKLPGDEPKPRTMSDIKV